MRVYYLFGCGPAALGENRVIVADSAGNEGGPRGGLKAGWARFPRSWRGPLPIPGSAAAGGPTRAFKMAWSVVAPATQKKAQAAAGRPGNDRIELPRRNFCNN